MQALWQSFSIVGHCVTLAAVYPSLWKPTSIYLSNGALVACLALWPRRSVWRGGRRQKPLAPVQDHDGAALLCAKKATWFGLWYPGGQSLLKPFPFDYSMGLFAIGNKRPPLCFLWCSAAVPWPGKSRQRRFARPLRHWLPKATRFLGGPPGLRSLLENSFFQRDCWPHEALQGTRLFRWTSSSRCVSIARVMA